LFAKMIEGKKLIQHEDLDPLTETYHYGPNDNEN
jgi:HAE1 family hydrophobic/amphiphilic exporter-1